MSINENSHFVPKFKRKRGLPRNALLILFPQIRVNLTGYNKNNLADDLYCKHGFMSAVDLGKDEDIEKFVIDCESQENGGSSEQISNFYALCVKIMLQ